MRKSPQSQAQISDPAPALQHLGSELQKELDTYKKENAAVKALRKQQEAVLADMTVQKNKVLWTAPNVWEVSVESCLFVF